MRHEKWAGPGPGAGGEEGCGRGSGFFIKDGNAYASRISSPAAPRAQVQPYIGLFPLDAYLRLPFGEGVGRVTVSRQRGPRVPESSPKGASSGRVPECARGSRAQPYIGFSRPRRAHAHPKEEDGAGLLCPDSVGYNHARVWVPSQRGVHRPGSCLMCAA